MLQEPDPALCPSLPFLGTGCTLTLILQGKMLFEIKLFVGMRRHPLVWRMGQRGPAEDPRRW